MTAVWRNGYDPTVLTAIMPNREWGTGLLAKNLSELIGGECLEYPLDINTRDSNLQ